MSHTSKLSGVPLKSISAIRTAVEKLAAGGLKVKLTANLNPRMYQDYQGGGSCNRGYQFKKDAERLLGRKLANDGTADYCIEIENGQYDVGLVWDPVKQQYDVIADSWAGHIGKVLGAQGKGITTGGMSATQADLGKFFVEYNVAQTYEWAADQGYMVESHTVDSNGEIHLEITGM